MILKIRLFKIFLTNQLIQKEKIALLKLKSTENSDFMLKAFQDNHGQNIWEILMSSSKIELSVRSLVGDYLQFSTSIIKI